MIVVHPDVMQRLRSGDGGKDDDGCGLTPDTFVKIS
jgi:hypothetical protein